MIQRIQTVYLLLSIVLVAVYFFTKSWLPGLEGFDWPLIGTAVFLGATVIAALLAMFSYSNRTKQVGNLTILQWIALAWFAFEIAIVYLFDVLTRLLDGTLSPIYYAVFLIPALIYILARMAKSSVQADIELIKSADRIR